MTTFLSDPVAIEKRPSSPAARNTRMALEDANTFNPEPLQACVRHPELAAGGHPRAVATLVAARHQEVAVTELLPCPFCGGAAERWSVPSLDEYEIRCGMCRTFMEGNTNDTLTADWNRRAVPQDGSAVEVAERITEIRRHHEVASTPEARGMSAAEWARQHATLAHWERGDLLEIAAALLARIHQLNDAFEWHDIPVPGKVEP
jgi:hypothetical protein